MSSPTRSGCVEDRKGGGREKGTRGRTQCRHAARIHAACVPVCVPLPLPVSVPLILFWVPSRLPLPLILPSQLSVALLLPVTATVPLPVPHPPPSQLPIPLLLILLLPCVHSQPPSSRHLLPQGAAEEACIRRGQAVPGSRPAVLCPCQQHTLLHDPGPGCSGSSSNPTESYPRPPSAP